jgi:hypothetical protein
MYSGIAAATSADAVSTVAKPKRRRRAASSDRINTSVPSVAAAWRCTCSRQALWVSNGRIALAA